MPWPTARRYFDSQRPSDDDFPMIPSIGTLSNLRTIEWSLLERNHCQFLACQGALAGLQGFTPSSPGACHDQLSQLRTRLSQMVAGPLPKLHAVL